MPGRAALNVGLPGCVSPLRHALKRIVWTLAATAGLIAVTAAPGTSFNHSEPFLDA
ncbi:hypothetical protein GCM10010532_088890 [Dactylosporangium siamense]|uniref:Uncharacterized protein n=1 Tax=Dactylosporangium siamense TaxID=685454 RepID=A0A919PWE0_9ACTN|nr:hypothetical protein Dsi01nite_076510 [Dactylosporangium siamense]